MKIRLLMLGKSRRPELRAVFDDYVTRVGHVCPIEITEVRDEVAASKGTKLGGLVVIEIMSFWLSDGSGPMP